MTIKESNSTPIGTHPSFASSCSRVECDHCGEIFTADCKVDESWQLHGQPVGYREYVDGEPHDYCSECEQEVFGE